MCRRGSRPTVKYMISDDAAAADYGDKEVCQSLSHQVPCWLGNFSRWRQACWQKLFSLRPVAVDDWVAKERGSS